MNDAIDYTVGPSCPRHRVDVMAQWFEQNHDGLIDVSVDSDDGLEVQISAWTHPDLDPIGGISTCVITMFDLALELDDGDDPDVMIALVDRYGVPFWLYRREHDE